MLSSLAWPHCGHVNMVSRMARSPLTVAVFALIILHSPQSVGSTYQGINPRISRPVDTLLCSPVIHRFSVFRSKPVYIRSNQVIIVHAGIFLFCADCFASRAVWLWNQYSVWLAADARRSGRGRSSVCGIARRICNGLLAGAGGKPSSRPLGFGWRCAVPGWCGNPLADTAHLNHGVASVQ